jgi:6-phosphogluconolactonase
MAVNCYQNPGQLAATAGIDFQQQMDGLTRSGKPVHIAFSGGTTPAVFFDRLALQEKDPAKRTDWSRIHIWWVDERCVPHDHPDSNFGMTRNHLLRLLNADQLHVHPILNNNPEEECKRYEDEMRSITCTPTGFPEFDHIFLGMGEDGHTASIFPDRMELLESDALFAAVTHPVSGQFRVTMTGRLILAAKQVSFMITGANKATVLQKILLRENDAVKYPAFHIAGGNTRIDWYLDEQAAQLIKHMCRG